MIARWKEESKQSKEEIISKNQKVTELEEELQMEREEASEAMKAAQRWRERQIREITAQKDKEIEELKAENARLQQLVNQQAQILHQDPIIPSSSK